MNKTTTTMLMAAGLIVLAGCKSDKVMDDRHFPAPENDAAVTQKDPAAREMAPFADENGKNGQPAVSGKERKAAPAPGFRPMEGSYAGEGLDDNAAPRRRRTKAAASEAGAKGSVYIVKKGDTLGRIAFRHKVSVDALRQANNLTPEKDRFLRIGAKLTIPAGGKYVAPAGKKGAKAASAPRRSGKKTPKLNADGTYTMVKGDNIPKVARKFGIRARALQAANNLTDEETTKLQIGHKLVIPTGDDVKVGSRKPVAIRKKDAVKKVTKTAGQQSAAEQQNSVIMPPDAPVASTTPVAPPPAENTAETTAVTPPPAQSEIPAAEGATDFVSVTGFNSLEEFAAKYNTTVDEIIRLNPRIDRNAPIATFGMLYVPRAAVK